MITVSSKTGVRVFWYLVLIFLYTPLLVVVLYSFNKANSPVVFTGVSFRWYQRLFNDPVILDAYKNSLILAIMSSIIATVIGSLLGYGTYAHRHRKLGWLIWMVYLPVVMPDIVYGISQMTFFTTIYQTLGLLKPGMLTMIVAHISFQVPFVALVIFSRLVGLDGKLFDACHDLYANAWQRAVYFIIPTLRPAIFAGFFLAFTLSIDDFVISFFTSGPQSTTLPIYIWSAVKKGITPEINAAAGILIGAIFVMATLAVSIKFARGKPKPAVTKTAS